jgi:uncharacterized protein YaaR (DUF327 family)
LKLLKQVEKREEQFKNEEPELDAKVAQISSCGRKLIITSTFENLKRSIDNLVKRVESHVYFSKVKHLEVPNLGERP